MASNVKAEIHNKIVSQVKTRLYKMGVSCRDTFRYWGVPWRHCLTVMTIAMLFQVRARLQKMGARSVMIIVYVVPGESSTSEDGHSVMIISMFKSLFMLFQVRARLQKMGALRWLFPCLSPCLCCSRCELDFRRWVLCSRWTSFSSRKLTGCKEWSRPSEWLWTISSSPSMEQS